MKSVLKVVINFSALRCPSIISFGLFYCDKELVSIVVKHLAGHFKYPSCDRILNVGCSLRINVN